jgi:hypothetical protein
LCAECRECCVQLASQLPDDRCIDRQR